jgi:hypothetical protein
VHGAAALSDDLPNVIDGGYDNEMPASDKYSAYIV